MTLPFFPKKRTSIEFNQVKKYLHEVDTQVVFDVCSAPTCHQQLAKESMLFDVVCMTKPKQRCYWHLLNQIANKRKSDLTNTAFAYEGASITSCKVADKPIEIMYFYRKWIGAYGTTS
jgi:hypothetical protein